MLKRLNKQMILHFCEKKFTNYFQSK